MVRFTIILLMVSFGLSAQMVKRFPFYTPPPAGEEYMDYIAWYKLDGNLYDEGGNYHATYSETVTYPDGTYLYFPEIDRDDYINLGSLVPTDCDTITIKYSIKLPTDDNTTYRTHGNSTQGAASNAGTYTVYDGNGSGLYQILVRGINADATDDLAGTSGGGCATLLTDSVWHHVIEVYRRVNATTFHWISWVDGDYCATGADTIIYKGGWELFGKNWIFGNSIVGSTFGVKQTYYDELMFFRGDIRYYPEGNYLPDLIADPYHLPFKK